ncbi:sigma-70 family RNA polymerase sigma factor [Paenochrobactrum pullorum]|uniref:sigma-70 family RNA polymerase sigma factor n=1 Tax=Paenochrobactrum pullorum TaxID=1324351 RepID=UPI0035BC0A00
MMPTTAANDNSPANDNVRPTAFDAALLKYQPGLGRLANRLMPDDAESLVQDTNLFAVERHTNFRGDPSQPKSGFWMWLQWNMRSIAYAKRHKKTGATSLKLDGVTRPNQLDYTELSQSLALLSGKGGLIIKRRAMGDTLQEIGRDIGVTRERVRQIENAARAKLLKQVG